MLLRVSFPKLSFNLLASLYQQSQAITTATKRPSLQSPLGISFILESARALGGKTGMSSSAETRKSGSQFQQLETPSATGGTQARADSAGSPTDSNSDSATTPTAEDFERWLQQLRGWFFELPSAGRVTVLALAIVVGFSLLRTVLEVVTSLVSLALLALVAYVVYKIFIAGDWPEGDA